MYNGEEFREVCASVSWFLSPEDTHDLCSAWTHCEKFTMRKLCSCLSLFSRNVGQASAPHGSGAVVAEAQLRLKLWGSQVELPEEFQIGMAL